MENNKIAFIYARKSNSGMNWISVEEQIGKMEQECRLKWYYYEIFQDTSSARIEWDRSEFGNMIMEIHKRNLEWEWEKVDYLMVYSISRITRNRNEMDILIELLEKGLIDVISYSETFPTDAAWKAKIIETLKWI